MNIFPYEKIPNGASIVLHGYGRIGREIINQLTGNSYCSIVAVVDKRAEYIMDCPVPIYDLYTEILAKYEYVVIAVENPSVVEEIKKKWVKSGISEDRIVSVDNYDEKLIEKPYLIKETGSKCVTVGVWCTSGLGDAIIDYALACRIKKLLKSKCKVTLITQYSDLFDDLDYIDEVKNRSDATYDFFFHNMMIPIIEYWSPEKIQTYSNTLYEYCEKCILDLKGFNNSIDYLKYLTFGKLQGKKRSEMIDIHSILPLCTERQFIRLNDENHDAVSRFGLKENNYIIVNRDVDQVQSMRHPKLWPLSHYNRLIEIIKQEYDELKVVQVGTKRKGNAINNVDLDLSGETTLKEVRALLYHSRFMISGEGGLVHLNNLLGKRAVVLYGPTDEDFFHYDEDIICVKRNGWCSIPCNYVRADYVDGCIKGGCPAGCMVDLKPEYVYDCIKAGGLL